MGDRLLSKPLDLGPRLMPNRTMHLAVNTGFAMDHEVGEVLFTHWRRLAEGGVGALVTGLTPVHPSSVYKSSVLRCAGAEDLPALRRLAEAVRGTDSLAFVQLMHNGAQMAGLPETGEVLSPSGLPVPGLANGGRALSRSEIHDLVVAFGDAAERCREAGLDGVEIHGAHGFLIHQFLSPLTNHRTDEYGGDPTRRRRFAREVLEEVRGRVGSSIVVGYRTVLDEYTDGGILPEEGLATAVALSDDGLVDYLSVSGGNYGSLERAISPFRVEPGSLVPMAARVRRAVGVPVVAANQIVTPDQAESVLQSGAADIVGLGRGLLADPAWPRRALEGRDADIRPCIGCNDCFAGGGVTTSDSITCAVNPDLGGVDDQVPVATGSERILVVGAGVSGLAFALEASGRGHDVTVRDRAWTTGGLVAEYSEEITRGRFGAYVDHAVHVLTSRGVTIELGVTVDAGDLLAAEDEFTVVALSTGAPPRTLELDLPGMPIITGLDFLGISPGSTVIMVSDDDGVEPLAVADWLAEHGVDLTIVMLETGLGGVAETLVRRVAMAALAEHGVAVHAGVSLVRLQDGVIELGGGVGGRTTLAVPDAVVVVAGRARRHDALSALAERLDHVLLVGEAAGSVGIGASIRHARDAARSLPMGRPA
jgi:2,4-dienoyl-CoA reductase (NADPH2)